VGAWGIERTPRVAGGAAGEQQVLRLRPAIRFAYRQTTPRMTSFRGTWLGPHLFRPKRNLRPLKKNCGLPKVTVEGVRARVGIKSCAGDGPVEAA
jgi:hypothetical protein